VRKKTPKIAEAVTDQPMLIVYARVSTAEQNLDMQIAALERAGVHRDHIHVEKVSGVSAARPGRDLALKDARAGDTLVVWKLDRVGRLVFALMAALAQFERDLTQERSREGVRRAKAAGKVFGQPPKVHAGNHRQIEAELHKGRSPRDVAKKFGMSTGCLRTWYDRNDLAEIRKSGPRDHLPVQKRKS
jgi:DNA invertase Pin-like site-specific DNA recombinase